MSMTAPDRKPAPWLIISLLGALSVISPFSIDMYLTAFPQMADNLGVAPSAISLTISSYFIGLALGQVFYGPLLDRYGRKKPLYVGLAIFIAASIGCALAPNIDALLAVRFVQALGACVAGVASLAIIHDLFPVEESAKILSRLFLFIAVSPLLAPTVGGIVALTFGWRAVFFLLAAIVVAILLLVWRVLPESHAPDAGISLKPGPIVREYMVILKQRRFATYALAGAFSFAGLFTYVAGSPIIFMDGFNLSPKFYNGIFALLATGFIGCSQLNGVLLKRWSSEQLFLRVLMLQAAAGIVFVTGSWLGWYGLYSTIALFFVFLSCTGIAYPNAAALALASFTRNAGSASALLGFLQLGVGAFISTGIGFFTTKDSFPIIAILAATSLIALAVLMFGSARDFTPAQEPAQPVA